MDGARSEEDKNARMRDGPRLALREGIAHGERSMAIPSALLVLLS
jgi:hypothetical protein